MSNEWVCSSESIVDQITFDSTSFLPCLCYVVRFLYKLLISPLGSYMSVRVSVFKCSLYILSFVFMEFNMPVVIRLHFLCFFFILYLFFWNMFIFRMLHKINESVIVKVPNTIYRLFVINVDVDAL